MSTSGPIFTRPMTGLLADPNNLDERTQEKLRQLDEIFGRWNKNISFVSKGDAEKIWVRHIVDSLQLMPLFVDVNKVADMGAGIGLPSLPLAIACPTVDFFAIEPDQKKCALMHEIIREIRIPNFHILAERVEKAYLSHMDVVCCRAFGEFQRDAKLAYKMLKPQGQFMTFKAARELEVPNGYEKLDHHEYHLPEYPRPFYVVTATKAGET